VKCVFVVNYLKDNTLHPDISIIDEFFGLILFIGRNGKTGPVDHLAPAFAFF
jgi:hypothetical protein